MRIYPRYLNDVDDTADIPVKVEELRLKRLAIEVQGGSVANILAPEDRPALRSPTYLAPTGPGNSSMPPNFTGNGQAREPGALPTNPPRQ